MYPSPSPNKMFQELYHRGHKVGQVYKDNVYLYNNFHFKIKYHVGSMPGKFRITGFEVKIPYLFNDVSDISHVKLYKTFVALLPVN